MHGYVLFPVQRSNQVTVYFRLSNITLPINKQTINLDDESSWANVTTLDGHGLVGIVQLNQPRKARYVTVRRRGLINLKEVQIYQQPSE